MHFSLRNQLRLITSLTVFLSCFTTAHEKGDTIVRIGAAMVSPDESSSVLYINGVPFPGSGVEVDDDTQLGISFTHMVSDNIGIELLAATPFSHTATATGLGAPLDVADIKHLPPTLSVQYYPLNPSSAFQFYVGVGINYTVFFDEELTPEFENALGSGDIELDDSVGFAVELGMDFQLTDSLSLNAAVWKADIGTTATIDLDAGVQIKADIDIDPYVYMVGLGIRF